MFGLFGGSKSVKRDLSEMPYVKGKDDGYDPDFYDTLSDLGSGCGMFFSTVYGTSGVYGYDTNNAEAVIRQAKVTAPQGADQFLVALYRRIGPAWYSPDKIRQVMRDEPAPR